MPVVPGYQHDVFVSYAHNDNHPFEGFDQGWVSTFFHNLKKRLAMKLGQKDLSVWMDHSELSGNGPLTTQIMQALRQTATFLVIVSPSYLESAWCKDEREQFLRLIKQRSNADSRIFLIEIDQVDKNLFPPEFGDLIGYRFWNLDKEFNKPRTLGFPFPTLSDQEYYRQLDRVCDELAEELKRLKKIMGPGPDPVAPTYKATVYLAETTDDLDSRREDVKDYLKQAGFNVLPETWQRYESLDDFNHTLDKDLSQCAVFIQLLSNLPGKKPFDNKHGLARLQYARAAASGKPILQWRDPNMDLDVKMDADQRALLEGPTVRAQAIEDFKREAVEAATPIEPPPPRPPGKTIFISVDQVDRARVEEIVSSPCWSQDIGYVMMPAADDPKAFRKLLEVGLQHCDAALVVYCGADSSWAIGQSLQCQKIIAQREPPLPAIAIYDGPPPPLERMELRDIIRLPNLRHLNCRESLDDLKEFLRSI